MASISKLKLWCPCELSVSPAAELVAVSQAVHTSITGGLTLSLLSYSPFPEPLIPTAALAPLSPAQISVWPNNESGGGTDPDQIQSVILGCS